MRTTQFISALGLALAVAGAGCGLVYAEENLPAATTQAENNLQTSISQAKIAQRYAEQHPSTTYPGLSKYLSQKIALAEQMASGQISGDTDAMVQVLDEATEATNLLLGANRKQSAKKPEPIARTDASQTEVASTKVQVTVVDPAAVSSLPQTTNGYAAETTNDISAEDVQDEVPAKVASEAQDNNVDIPNTGENHRASVVTLVVAGLIVVAITAATAVVIVRSNRK